MKRILRILAITVLFLVAVFAVLIALWRMDMNDRATVVLTGKIEPETFFSYRDQLMGETRSKKLVIARDSEGGNWEAALALGKLIHRYGWDVEVQGLCASSCAIFIFPAGKTKYLNSDSLLLFHGGPHQANLREVYEAVDRAEGAGESPESIMSTLAEIQGPEGTEGRGEYLLGSEAARLRIRQFMGLEDVSSELAGMEQMVEASDRFYAELGLNIHLPTYGQIGRYEPNYKSGKYGGFMYPLDSLDRLGVRNIRVHGGEWHPEWHPLFPRLYEVTYP